MNAQTQSNSPTSWKSTILAGLANYIDSGSIVASSAALALWVEAYHLSSQFVGLIGAISANAISAGIGAVVGGRLCDKFGRKKIYQIDMLFYSFGMLWLVFSTQPWMILLGTVLVGLAVGADIPASWSLIAEGAPEGQRGKHSGVAQVLWYMGPVVVLLMFLVLEPLGLTGARIVFAHLAVLGVALTFFRTKMKESQQWEEASKAAAANATPKVSIRTLLEPRHLKSILFLAAMYGFWNLWAGTNGLFFPYILRTVGNQGQATSVAVQAYMFALGIFSVTCIFMPFSDRLNQRTMFAVAALLQVAGMVLLAILPMTLPVALAHVTLVALGGGFGAQSFFQLWSSELFPTLLRSTAQGITFAIVRISLGFWSFCVPMLAKADFHTLAWILVGFLTLSGLIGTIWAPRNEGKSLDEIQKGADFDVA